MLSKIDIAILSHIEQYGFITIQQCADMFYRTKYGYDTAKRKLSKMHKDKLIKHVDLQYNSKVKIYYNGKKPSVHRILLMDFYAKLKYKGSEILQFQSEFKACNIVSDGFCIFKYKDIIKALFIEVDLWNKTKSNKYLDCYNSNVIQSKLGTFPLVVVIDNNNFKVNKEDKKQPYIIIRNNLDNIIKKIMQ